MNARRLTAGATALAAVLSIGGCGAEAELFMPDVIGKNLEVSLSDITRAGINDEVEVIGGGLFGVVDEANWLVCEQEPVAGQVVTSIPRVTVERSCDGDEVPEPDGEDPQPESSEAAEEPEGEPTEDPAKSEPYTYEGPEYEVVAVDSGVGLGVLDEHWVLTEPFDYSNEDYKDQVKMIITDVARNAGTAELLVNVVTDAEVIEAESASTIAGYMESIDQDYWRDVMVPKEAEHWVAHYGGGLKDGELSSDDSAFAIDWWIADDYEHEAWKPSVEN